MFMYTHVLPIATLRSDSIDVRCLAGFGVLVVLLFRLLYLLPVQHAAFYQLTSNTHTHTHKRSFDRAWRCVPDVFLAPFYCVDGLLPLCPVLLLLLCLCLPVAVRIAWVVIFTTLPGTPTRYKCCELFVCVCVCVFFSFRSLLHVL